MSNAVREAAAPRIAASIVARHIRASKDISTLSPLEEAELAIWRLDANDLQLHAEYMDVTMSYLSAIDWANVTDEQQAEMVDTLQKHPGREGSLRAQEAKRYLQRAINMLDTTDEAKREVVNIIARRNRSFVDVHALLAI